MDRQTVYKESMGYYIIHKEKLLKEGFKIVKDTRSYTVFEKSENAKPEESQQNS